MKDRKILVTGGAGYIGSVIVELLIEKGFEVAVFDSLVKGHLQAVHPQAKFIKGELADKQSLLSLFDDHQIEAVIHMAALSVVEESVEKPAEYFQINVVGGLNLLEAMLARGGRKIIFSSTAAVYGEPATVPITEDASANPANPYGASKLMFEQILHWYSQAYYLDCISLRYFNAAGATRNYGPDQHPLTHLIPRVLKVALRRDGFDHIEIFGTDYPTRDGTAIRDYIDVRDLAEAHILALESLREQKRSQGKEFASVYNLGNGAGYSVREVVETAREVTGCEIPVVEGKRRPGDPATLVASSEKIQAELDWQPKYPDLKSIISSAWAWMQNHPEGYKD